MSNYDSLSTKLLYLKSYQESFNAYSAYIQGLNLQSMSYVFIPDSPFQHHNSAVPRFSVTENFSQSFLEQYEVQQFQHDDYILNKIMNGETSSVHLWEEDRKSGQLTQNEDGVLEIARHDHDMEHGCSILTDKSIHGIGAISLIGDQTDSLFTQHIKDNKQELYEASSIFHNHIVTRSYEVATFIDPAVFSVLTVTEKKVLKVLLEGYSVPVIAERVFRGRKYTEKLISDIRFKIGGELSNGKPRISKDRLIHFCGLMRIYNEL